MSAIRYLKAITPLTKSSTSQSGCCENAIFRIHNKFTVALLVGGSVLLTATEFFGKPISCITDLPKNVIETYCWISATFTMPDYANREMGINGPPISPGVYSPYGYDDEEIENNWKFHNYYQWVTCVLFLQAACFYLPKYLWKQCEGGLMEAASTNLTKSLYKEEDIAGRKRVVIDYILQHIKMHDGYAFKYWACELLCFINVIAQLLILDAFLGGEFRNYGWKVLDYSDMDQENRVDPMIYVFPRMTKCNFHQFGPSGTIMRMDSYCILPQNILNEKMFLVIWFWFIILAVLLGFLILYRVAIIFVPGLRPRIIYANTRMVPLETLKVLSEKTSIGDWWIIYLLSSTLDANIYRDIVMRLAKEIETDMSNKLRLNGQNGVDRNGPASAPSLYASSSV